LVEHEHVHARVDQLREGESSLLTARQIAHVFVNVVTGEQELREKRSQLAGSRRRRRDAAQLHNYLVAVVEIVKLLRVVTNLNLRAPADFTAERLELFEYRF